MSFLISGTQLRVYENIPFQSDYKHVRWFTSESERTTYFNSFTPVFTANDFNFQRQNAVQGVKIGMNAEQLRHVTYLTFINTGHGNKRYYCFVDKIEPLNTNTTLIHVSLDVFQTYRFDFVFKSSYVLRQHARQNNSDGSPVEFPVDEGLDYGSEYETVSYHRLTPFQPQCKFLVVVCKEPFHTSETTFEFPPIGGIQQALHYYFVPFNVGNNYYGETYNVITKSGTTVTLGSTHSFLSFLMSDVRAINNVVNMYVSDYIGIDFSVDGGQLRQNAESKVNFVGVNKDGLTNTGASALWVHHSSGFDVKEITFPNFRSYFGLEGKGKLLNAPYSVLTLDDFKGNRIDLNPVHINGNDLILVFRGSLSPDNKVSIGVRNINTRLSNNSALNHLSQEIELLNVNPQSLPIRVDQLSAYMQGNRNSLQNKRNQTAFNAGMTVVNGATQFASAKAKGNADGVAQSIGGTIQGLGASYFTVQGINALIKDISNIPPSLQSKGTNSYYDYGYNNNGVMLLFKTVRERNRQILEDVFKQYGYQTNRVITPDLRSMTQWNYIQTENAGIFGSIPNEDLITLRSIFDSGVTLWHTNDLGNYNLTNGVR